MNNESDTFWLRSKCFHSVERQNNAFSRNFQRHAGKTGDAGGTYHVYYSG
jgi:hypothetical protein